MFDIRISLKEINPKIIAYETNILLKIYHYIQRRFKYINQHKNIINK